MAFAGAFFTAAFFAAAFGVALLLASAMTFLLVEISTNGADCGAQN